MTSFDGRLKKTLLASAAAGVLMVGVAGEANASAYGLTDLEIRNLVLTGAPGFGPSLQFSANTSAFLIPGGNASGADIAFSGFNETTGSPGDVNPAHAYVGPGGLNPGEDSFTAVGDTPNFARSDHHLIDTSINPPSHNGGDWDGITEASVANGTSAMAHFVKRRHH